MRFFVILFMVIASNQFSFADRKITAYLNPGCPPSVCDNNNNNLMTVVHIIADGNSDRMHYVWDFTGKPSILMALTTLNTTLDIKWADFEDGKMNTVQFSEPPMYSSSIVVNKLIQYNDPDDLAQLPTSENSTEIFAIDLGEVIWTREKYFVVNSEVQASVSGTNYPLLGNGSIGIEFKCYGTQDHDIQFPHLLHSSNASQIDLVLDALKIQDGFRNARFAVEVFLVASEPRSGNEFVVTTNKGLDDEHTPGVFEIIDISSPLTQNDNGTYIQFRPISYTHHERDVSTSTEIKLSKLETIDIDQLEGTLAWSFYGYDLENDLVQGINISIGLSRDGFYTRSNYTTLTFATGYGAPPTDELSLFVAVIAGICLIIPVLLIVGGALFMCSRARQRRRNFY